MIKQKLRRVSVFLFKSIAFLSLLWPFNVLADELPAAPGRLITVGAHKLHIYCVGTGSPTVILEAGLGGSALEWTTVQTELSRSFRVCSYDRAGMGWSDAGPLPRSALQITDELHSLLQNAEEAGPFVLAGHSFGGYSAQLFASRFPQLSVGLVLIDSSHPAQIERFAAPPVGVNIAPKGRLMHLIPVQIADNMPAELRDTAAALIMDYKSRLAVTKELQSFRLSAHQLMQHETLPAVPLLVLTRGVQKWPDNARGNRMENLWQQLQSELAQRTDNAAQIIARRSGHHIHLDQPELVSEAIRLVATAARQQSKPASRVWLAQGLHSAATRFGERVKVEYTTVGQPMLAMHR